MTVDSCRDHNSLGDNAVLAYLDELGIEPEDRLCLIVASHWHDDHIGGLSQIISAAPSAKVAITSALDFPGFRAAIAPWFANDEGSSKGIRELRKLGPRLRDLRPVLASENKVLFERNAPWPCHVRALSPSDSAVIACIARLNDIDQSNWTGRLPSLHGNHTSVVISVEVANHRILLGADLEVRASRDHGWLAVVDAHALSGRPKHQVYKIAHHGSENGDHDEIWDHLLEPAAHALLSPFVNGKVKLPKDSDTTRISGRTNNAWITAPPKGKKLRVDRSVQRMMNTQARKVEVVPRGFGHIRLRGRLDNDPSDWEVECFGGAAKLQPLP